MAVWVATCLAGVGLQSHQMAPLSLEDLARSADWIVHGTVQSMVCLKDPERGIHTRVTLAPIEILKGDPGNRAVVEVVCAGGILGERRVIVPMQAEYRIGEEIVAFLIRNDKGEGVAIGLSQGKFEVYTPEGATQKMVRNPFHGWLNGKPNPEVRSRSVSVNSETGLSGPLLLSALKAKIRKEAQ